MDELRTSPLERFVDRLETTEALDRPAAAVEAVVEATGGLSSKLRGDWLGHAMHPLLTDFPLGCWLSVGLLDLVGGPSTRIARRRLVGIGVLAAVPTLASGAAEWGEIESPDTRRVASVHALGNLLATTAYLVSWRQRHEGKHKAGVAWAMAGGLISILTGYLGGHLAVGLGVGQGERWRDVPVDQLPG